MSKSARVRGLKLRKIVEVLEHPLDLYSSKKVMLECGHETWCHGGSIYRARCRKCERAISQNQQRGGE